MPVAEEPSWQAPIVTLGFDDGTSDHFGVGRMLAEHRLKAVFYLNSGRLDNPSYLTTAQARALQAEGHEIGGHTVFHLNLAQLDPAEQQRQVCVDRRQLLAAGLQAADFAYPFSDFGRATESIVRSCGYRSARTTDGLGCAGCPGFQRLPIADRYRTEGLSGFGADTTADDLKQAVRRADQSHAWLQLVFHRICQADCDAGSVRFSVLTEFAAWLAQRRDAGQVRTATVMEALNTHVKPGASPPASTATTLTFPNGSLEEPGATPGAPPRCFAYGPAGAEDTGTWQVVADAYTGRRALRATVTGPAGVRLSTAQDLGSCAPPLTAGGRYAISLWYKATSPIRVVSYARQPQGGYRTLGSAHFFPAARTWSPAFWTAGPAPDRTGLALSVSLTMSVPGTYTFDDFALFRLAEKREIVHAAAVPPVKKEPAPAKRKPRLAASKAPDPQVSFIPANADPLLPAAAKQGAHTDPAGGPRWLGYAELAAVLVLAFVAVVMLDLRFRHLHRRTRRPIPAERGNSSSPAPTG